MSLDQGELGFFLRKVSAGGTLFFEGQESNYMLCVTSGWLALSKSLENGQIQIIDFALPGDFVDPTSADALTSAFTIEAVTAATVSIIPMKRWRELLQESPELRQKAYRSEAATRARRAERMLRLGKGCAEMRVAYALLEFYVRLSPGNISVPPFIHVPLNQQQLGSFVGLSSVHVCRTLRHMHRNGIIMVCDQMDIRISDLDGLLKLANLNLETLKREIQVASRPTPV